MLPGVDPHCRLRLAFSRETLAGLGWIENVCISGDYTQRRAAEHNMYNQPKLRNAYSTSTLGTAHTSRVLPASHDTVLSSTLASGPDTVQRYPVRANSQI